MQRGSLRSRERQMQGRRCHRGRELTRRHRHQQLRVTPPSPQDRLRLQGGLRRRPLRDRLERVREGALPDIHAMLA